MNVSVKWLGNYFKKPLPPVEDICHGLTFHAFEVESYNEDVIDIDILPNRACIGRIKPILPASQAMICLSSVSGAFHLATLPHRN